MAEAKASSNSSDDRQKTTRKRASRSNELGSPESLNSGVPCGACKFLRRRCVDGCIFAPHFGSDQGTALFAAVHKVFGASNVSKLLVHLPAHHQRHAVQTISFEAQARLSDPVYGCVSTIIALQQQIGTLKMELATVQNKLINNRLMVATTLQEGSQQQPEPVRQYDMHPVYSSGPSASNNSMINMDIFDSSLDNFAGDHQTALQSQEFQPSFDPQFFQPFCKNDDYEEESGEFFAFADQLLQSS